MVEMRDECVAGSLIFADSFTRHCLFQNTKHTMTDLREQIRSLLADDQTEAAIDTLMQWAKTRYAELYDQCVLLRSRWEKIEEESALGLISREDAMRQTNQVNAGLLALMAGLEPAKRSASVDTPSALPPRRRLYLALASLFAGLALLGAYALGWFKFDKKTPEKTETTTAAATVRMPDGASVTIVENGQEVTYDVQDARLEKLSAAKNRLSLRLLCSPMLSPRRPMNFWAASFRFHPADGSAALAPSNDLNLIAESHASTEGQLQFVLPAELSGGTLTIKFVEKEEGIDLNW